MPDPIVNADGEVIAENEEQRRDYVDRMLATIVAAEAAAALAADARRHLEAVGQVGDVHAGHDGWAATIEPPATPPRKVVPHAIDAADEALGPIGLGRKETKVVEVTYPSVADLTSTAARAALARAGLNAAQFLHTPEQGPPRIVVVKPDPA